MTTYTVVEYQFGSGQTIEAAIKLINHTSLTPMVMKRLMADYTKINGDGVPRLGSTVYIPVFTGFIGMNQKYKTITIEV